MKRILIHVDKQGNPSVKEVNGYGSNCLEATRAWEEMMGKVNEDSRELTTEFHEPLKLDLEQSLE